MNSNSITRTYTASGAIVAGRAVYITGANTVAQGNAAGLPGGIALAAAADGESVDVCISGVCLASAGTHDFLVSDANGLLDPASSDGERYIARFLGERAAADGDTAIPVCVEFGFFYVAP